MEIPCVNSAVCRNKISEIGQMFCGECTDVRKTVQRERIAKDGLHTENNNLRENLACSQAKNDLLVHTLTDKIKELEILLKEKFELEEKLEYLKITVQEIELNNERLQSQVVFLEKERDVLIVEKSLLKMELEKTEKFLQN